MRLMPIVVIFALTASPAVAGPAEDIAVQTGKAAGSYSRAKKFCREAGFTMPEVQEVNPPLQKVFLKVLADYEEPFWSGYEKGQEEASAWLKKPDANVESICEKYRSVVTPKK